MPDLFSRARRDLCSMVRKYRWHACGCNLLDDCIETWNQKRKENIPKSSICANGTGISGPRARRARCRGFQVVQIELYAHQEREKIVVNDLMKAFKTSWCLLNRSFSSPNRWIRKSSLTMEHGCHIKCAYSFNSIALYSRIVGVLVVAHEYVSFLPFLAFPALHVHWKQHRGNLLHHQQHSVLPQCHASLQHGSGDGWC